MFARGGEEAEALAAAGVPFEFVPGVTSAIAVPAYAGIPVTQRFSSTSFTVVTGHEDPSIGDDGSVDWDAVARVGGTIVVLMGVGRIARICDRLIAAGRAPGHAGRRGHLGHPPRAAHRARHPRPRCPTRTSSRRPPSSWAPSPASTWAGSRPVRSSAGPWW